MGMTYFKYFLYGREFILNTSHKALKALNRGEIKSLRIHRWLEKVSEYNFRVVYNKGEDIPHVDFPSRLYMSTNEEEIDNIKEMKPAHFI